MDRRRVAQGSPAVEEGDRRKRRKQSSEPQVSQIESRAVFEAVWNYQERNRNIRQHFEELPSKDLYPDYYMKIANPISLHEIKTKLDKNQYATFGAIKKDLLLMCDNATTYNKAKSQIHSDSLRLRKLVESHEKQYVNTGVKRELETQPTPGRTSTRGSRGGPAAMQQAMLKIIDDLLSLTHESGEFISQYFKNLPSRKFYADYFRLIARPISLNQIRIKVKDSKYQQWPEFEEDVLLIRKNAEEYNAEGSDIVRDARALEAHFQKRLYEEKAKLGDSASSGIKLRLNIGAQSPHEQAAPTVPKIKLNIGKQPPPPPVVSSQVTRQSNTNGLSYPTPQPSQSSRAPPPAPVAPTPAASLTPSTARTHAVPRPSPPPSNHNSQTPALIPANVSRQPIMVHSTSRIAATPRARLGPIKTSPPPGSVAVCPRSETPHSQPAISPSVGNSMPPPAQRMSSTPRPPSYSPIPPPARNTPVVGPTSVPQAYQPAYVHHQEPLVRPEGKDKTDALITNLRITSTSILNQEDKFSRDLEPDDRKVTAQYFIHLPTEFETVTITPTLAPTLIIREQYIVRVVHWSNNIQMSKPVMQTGQLKKNEPMYSMRLNPGVVNTVEITAVTQAQKGGINGVNGFAAGVERWEMERFRVYISPCM